MTPEPGADASVLQLANALAAAGRSLDARGWCLATGGNLSAVVKRDPFELLITASGRHKGRLGPADFLIVDREGEPLAPDSPRPSAETALHLWACEERGAGAVLHTHSVAATLLTRDLPETAIELEGLEMLKAYAGVLTHQTRLSLPVLDNSQDLGELVAGARERSAAPSTSRPPCLLIRGHGLYAWGADVDEALRHLEATEFFLELRLRELSLKR